MNSRRLDELDELMTDDFTRHCQATPDVAVRSREEFKTFLRGFAGYLVVYQVLTSVAALRGYGQYLIGTARRWA